MTNEHRSTFCHKEILWKMGIFSGRRMSIDEWCCAYDKVDLGLTWGVIKYLPWETKWLTNSMIGKDFSKF